MTLTKVQRLKLLAGLASHFSGQSYDLIDAAFEVFEIPTLDIWEGTHHSYVLHLLKNNADDETLLELAEYAGLPTEIELSASPASTPAKITEQFRTFRLFISHLSAHRELAGEIRKKLLTYGIHSRCP